MTWHCKSIDGYLRSSQEAWDNCYQIYSILSSYGWTLNAISGVLGNIEAESSYNPWRWGDDVVLPNDSPWIDTREPDGQGGYKNHAYGLCQWDVAGKYIRNGTGYSGYGPNYSNQVGSNGDGIAQMGYLNDHADYIPTGTYPETYAEYKVNTNSAAWNAQAWFANFERGTWTPDRITAAEYWFNEFGGIPPIPPAGLDDILIFKHFIDKNHKKGYII